MIGEKELERHCIEVYVDAEETIEQQRQRIARYERKGNQQFTEQGRVAEMSVFSKLKPACKITKCAGQKTTW